MRRGGERQGERGPDLCPGKEREDVERTEDPIRCHPRFLRLSTVEEGVLGGLGGARHAWQASEEAT